MSDRDGLRPPVPDLDPDTAAGQVTARAERPADRTDPDGAAGLSGQPVAAVSAAGVVRADLHPDVGRRPGQPVEAERAHTGRGDVPGPVELAHEQRPAGAAATRDLLGGGPVLVMRCAAGQHHHRDQRRDGASSDTNDTTWFPHTHMMPRTVTDRSRFQTAVITPCEMVTAMEYRWKTRRRQPIRIDAKTAAAAEEAHAQGRHGDPATRPRDVAAVWEDTCHLCAAHEGLKVTMTPGVEPVAS